MNNSYFYPKKYYKLCRKSLPNTKKIILSIPQIGRRKYLIKAKWYYSYLLRVNSNANVTWSNSLRTKIHGQGNFRMGSSDAEEWRISLLLKKTPFFTSYPVNRLKWARSSYDVEIITLKVNMTRLSEVVPCEFHQRISWIRNNQRFLTFTWFFTIVNIQSQLCDCEDGSDPIWNLKVQLPNTNKKKFSKEYCLRTRYWQVWRYTGAYIDKCIPVKHPIR